MAIKFCFVLRRIERQALRSILTRRQFASSFAAIVAGGAVGGIVGARVARGRPEHFTRPLPILPLIDAAKQGNAVNLKVASGKHPFVGDTARQIYMGLAGLILVDDGSDARLNLPHTYGVDDLPIILQDRSFDSDGSLLYDLDPLTIQYGSRGDTIIMTGLRFEKSTMISDRSAGEILSCCMATGAERKPASDSMM